ncbi:MAG: hypothetical protein RMI94_00660 [Bryobacterales bacterium]|nr:hypothetical protein [Bryobacterales bacterium]
MHLAAILQSNAFRSSARCQEFLSHVVELALAGKRDELKERLIGVQLFGRDASYDTGDDPIVRVKANEVRKRLAQAYEECGTPEGVKIVLPAGSYVPQFLLESDSEPGDSSVSVRPAARRLSRWRHVWAVAAALAGIAVAAYWWWSRSSALDRFWQPLLEAPSPLVVSLGESEILRVSPALGQAVAAADKASEVRLPASELAIVRNQFISLAHFRGLLEIHQFCQRRGKPVVFRPGVELSADELRQSPILFVGAFSNAWTLREHADLRFRFERVQPGLAIIEASPGTRSWRIASEDPKSAEVDYALVTRVLGTNRQGPRVYAAGLTRFGTQAALDFLAQPAYWRDVERHLAPGWERRNVQLVLRVQIVAGSPHPAALLTSHVW